MRTNYLQVYPNDCAYEIANIQMIDYLQDKPSEFNDN